MQTLKASLPTRKEDAFIILNDLELLLDAIFAPAAEELNACGNYYRDRRDERTLTLRAVI